MEGIERQGEGGKSAQVRCRSEIGNGPKVPWKPFGYILGHVSTLDARSNLLSW